MSFSQFARRLTAALAHSTPPRGPADRSARSRRVVLSVLQLDDRSLPSAVTVNLGSVVQDNFQGAGYHVLIPNDMSTKTFNEVFAKRVSEIQANSYARIFYSLKDYAPDNTTRTPNSAGMQNLTKLLDLYQRLGTTVYLTGIYTAKGDYFAGTPITHATIKAQYANAVGDFLQYLVRTRGYTCVKQWCLTNELQGGFDGASGNFDYSDTAARLLNYKDHVQLVRNQITSRGLNVQVQATDDLGRIDTIRGSVPWAVRNMNSLVGVYGGHDYAQAGAWGTYNPYQGGAWTNFASETGDDWYDPAKFAGIQTRYRYYSTTAISGTGKDFILGEMGGRIEGYDLPNGRVDAARDRNDPKNGVYLADKVIAALNAGIGGIAKWAINDTYTVYPSGWTAYNQWGNWQDDRNGHGVLAEHYAYGLLSRYLKNNSTVYSTSSTVANVHAAAVKHNSTGKYTFVVTNRTTGSDTLTLTLQGTASGLTTLRRFVYNPNGVPTNAFGDLQAYTGTVTVTNGRFTDTVPAGVLVVYTNDFDTAAPAAVRGFNRATSGNTNTLTWTANAEPDVMYYRVYRGTTPGFTPSAANRIGSTYGTGFADTVGSNPGGYYYVVRAVDRSGNESPLPTGPTIASATTTSTVGPEYVARSYDGQATGSGSYQTLGLRTGQQVTYTLTQASSLSRIDVALGMTATKRFTIEVEIGGVWHSLGQQTWDTGVAGGYDSYSFATRTGVTKIRVTAVDDWVYLDEIRLFA